MKKYIDTAFGYAIAALAAGVFYREFTKWNGFSGITALGKVHTHLFLLGMVIFLLAALFCTQKDLPKLKTFRVFVRLYNIGVPLTAAMMVVRGIPQVLHIPLETTDVLSVQRCFVHAQNSPSTDVHGCTSVEDDSNGLIVSIFSRF